MNPLPNSAIAPTSGIISAYRFDPSGAAHEIGNEAIAAALTSADGWVWIHLALADQRCRAWIAQAAFLSAAARETLVDPDEHVRLDIIGDELIGVLPDFQQQFSQTSDEVVRVHVVMSERLLISARRRPVHSIEVVKRAVEGGRPFVSPGAFLAAIVDQFADSISSMNERFGDELDLIEDHVLHEALEDEAPRLARVRLQAVRVRRQLSQLRSLFQRLQHRIDSDPMPAASALRLLAQKLDSIDNEMNSLYERARLLQDEIAAKLAAIGNRRLFTLSVLTACLLPPTLMTGFFGMNTKDLPFQNTDGGTWYAMACALAAGGVTYWVLKRVGAL